MLLLNRSALGLSIADEQWEDLLEAGRGRGWQPQPWIAPLALDANERPFGVQAPGEDCASLAKALNEYPRPELAGRLKMSPEALSSLLEFLGQGSLLALSAQLSRLR